MNIARDFRPAPTPGRRPWLLLLVLAAGATAIVRWDIASRREDLYAEARTAHRLLSQATSRVDAVLMTLVLTAAPGDGGAPVVDAATRLPAVYPQVVQAWRRDTRPTGANGGLQPELDLAQQRSLELPTALRHAVIAAVDPAAAQYTLVLAGEPASFALRVDARRLVAAEEWPWAQGAPVRVTLALAGQVLALQSAPPGHRLPFGLTDGFESTKVLASASQPFVLQVQRFTGPSEWPWTTLAAWLVLCAGLHWAGSRWIDDRAARRRAAEQVRLGQASRLNAMGELAAGIAHELNQPLSALLASTQTALRIARDSATPQGLRVDEDDASTVLAALALAGDQARRASAVVARLRQRLQPGGSPPEALPVDVAEVARRLTRLMSDDLRAAGVRVTIRAEEGLAMADPVAVEQILHNLLTNAIQALQALPIRRRSIAIEVLHRGERIQCQVCDSGAGIPEAVVPRLFEPFFTTRADGLGLGLPLCQTLATAMDGQVTLTKNSSDGVTFELDLPARTSASIHP
jgi:signal transduction histidine kinase